MSILKIGVKFKIKGREFTYEIINMIKEKNGVKLICKATANIGKGKIEEENHNFKIVEYKLKDIARSLDITENIKII